jgi:fibronectin-binding autotransporter adhesin
MLFSDFATAENAVVVSAAGGAGTYGGNMFFYNSSTAGNATIIAEAGFDGGTGGLIRFVQDSSGGTARAQILGNGLLQIDTHNPPGMTIGSLEGAGHVMVGPNTLTVGSNGLSTAFSGVIEGTGSLTKIGAGVLTLSGPNRYTGHTTVTEGTLLVDGSGSGTGTGIVLVTGGTLGGSGNIAGLVKIGTSSGAAAFLSPGDTAIGTLSIRRQLTIRPGATYQCELSAATSTADQVIAKGVRINPGALFSFVALDSGTLAPGTAFKVIENRSGSNIHGTFSNLADGSTFTAGGNTFAVNYEGGNGNDLTLTVVP